MARNNIKFLPATALLLLASCATTPPQPELPAPQDWLQKTEQQAIADGVSPATVHAALDDFRPDERVIALDQKQPEGMITFATYWRHIVTPARVKKGAAIMRQYAADLRVISMRTGVPPQMIVALWGLESSFGANMGNYETVNALATLTWQGRRATFFRNELFAALHILDQNHMDASQLRGSWAGAMGQCQFMPTTYLKYAVDGDNDGRRDIWGDPQDVMASIANYLAAEGWTHGQGWGREVTPGDIDFSETGIDKPHMLSEWVGGGVRAVTAPPLPRDTTRAALLEPDGAGGPAFLAYDNLHALLRWNRSTYFAVSAGLLADAIAQQAEK